MSKIRGPQAIDLKYTCPKLSPEFCGPPAPFPTFSKIRGPQGIHSESPCPELSPQFSGPRHFLKSPKSAGRRHSFRMPMSKLSGPRPLPNSPESAGRKSFIQKNPSPEISPRSRAAKRSRNRVTKKGAPPRRNGPGGAP
jgi:hypothetical protein